MALRGLDAARLAGPDGCREFAGLSFARLLCKLPFPLINRAGRPLGYVTARFARYDHTKSRASVPFGARQ